MEDAKVLEAFGVTDEKLDQLEVDATSGILHGEPVGEVEVGRPRMFGEEMRQVGFKEPLSKIAAIDSRAAQLGMRRSEYLRHLVEADLAKA